MDGLATPRISARAPLGATSRRPRVAVRVSALGAAGADAATLRRRGRHGGEAGGAPAL